MACMMRDLHDGPLQDVFATMIRLDTLALHTATDVAEELRTLSALQSRVIRQMRELCQDPRAQREARPPSEKLMDVVADAALALGFAPELTVDRRLDLITDPALVRDIQLVTRECLSNAARHSGASHVSVRLTIRNSRLALTITDNGVGLSPTAQRGNGLANLRSRAARHAGSCTVVTPPSGGTVVRWRVPLNRDGDQYGSTGGPDGSSWLRRIAAV